MTSRPLSQWLALLVVAVIFLTSLASFFLIDNLLGSLATADINTRARGLMETMLAVRQYTDEKTTPIIEPLNFQKSQKFLPQSVPSYAAKSVFAEMQKTTQFRNYSYREAVSYPTNPEDLPSELEAAIINRFRSNPKLQEVSGEDINPILSFHYTAHPLIVTSSSCLRCHSTPEQAPLSLINAYGPKNGFGWKVGEIIGAQIVKVPMNQIYEKKDELKKSLLALIVGCLVALAVVMFYGLDYLLVRPLSKFTIVADAASQSPSTITFPKSSSVEELNRLQRSLERLRVSLLVAMNLVQKP